MRWRGIAGMQVMVDITTPAETFERVDRAVAAHLEANATEFTGKHLVVANNAGDPLKYMLCVWWEHAQTGSLLSQFALHAL